MERATCAFTGYRPHRFPWKGNEDDPRCVALKETMTDQIATLANSGVTNFFTGGAAGVDYEKRKVMRSEVLDTVRENGRQRNHFA